MTTRYQRTENVIRKISGHDELKALREADRNHEEREKLSWPARIFLGAIMFLAILISVLHGLGVL